MNKKYESVLNKLKDLHSNKQIDETVFQSLACLCQLKHHRLNDKLDDDIKEETLYTKKSYEELMSMLEYPNFQNLSDVKLINLFQEIHNRFMSQSKNEVTRQVYVGVSLDHGGADAFMDYENDLLFVNNERICEVKSLNNYDGNLNKTSCGKFFMDVVLHESQHIMQVENALDFVMESSDDLEKDFSACMTLINAVNYGLSSKFGNYEYIDDHKRNYLFHFIEHEANYTAFKCVTNSVPENRKDFSYYQYLNEATSYDLGFYPTLDSQNNEQKIQNRVYSMEEYIKTMFNYFALGVANCDIKSRVIETVSKYLKVDENGNSQFRTRMKNELNELLENYLKSDKVINEESELTF